MTATRLPDVALDELEALYDKHYGSPNARVEDALARAIRTVLVNNGRTDPASQDRYEATILGYWNLTGGFYHRQVEHAEDIRWYLSQTSHPGDRPRKGYGVRTSHVRPLP